MLKFYNKNLNILNIFDYLNKDYLMLCSVYDVKYLKNLNLKEKLLMKKSLLKLFFIKNNLSGGFLYIIFSKYDINYLDLINNIEDININYILYKKYNYIINKNDIKDLYNHNLILNFIFKYNFNFYKYFFSNIFIFLNNFNKLLSYAK